MEETGSSSSRVASGIRTCTLWSGNTRHSTIVSGEWPKYRYFTFENWHLKTFIVLPLRAKISVFFYTQKKDNVICSWFPRYWVFRRVRIRCLFFYQLQCRWIFRPVTLPIAIEGHSILSPIVVFILQWGRVISNKCGSLTCSSVCFQKDEKYILCKYIWTNKYPIDELMRVNLMYTYFF